jgi:hypothetical protein
MLRMGYVQCRVSPGFFESEFYVVLNDSSAYVDRKNVWVETLPTKDHEVDGKVLAYLVDERPDKALIEIPGQAVVGGLRTWIPKAVFEPIPVRA